LLSGSSFYAGYYFFGVGLELESNLLVRLKRYLILIVARTCWV